MSEAVSFCFYRIYKTINLVNNSFRMFGRMFSSAKSLKKIESLQKRVLYSDYESPYDTLLAKSGKVTMKASRLKSLCVEIMYELNKPIVYERNF